MTKLIQLSLACATTILLGSAAVHAGKTPDSQGEYIRRYEPVLKAVASVELPAKAASLVKEAEDQAKEPVALALIHVVSKINPAATPVVVGAIARAEPKVGPRLADEAAKLQPKLAREIKIASTVQVPPTPLPNPVPTDGSSRIGPLPTSEPEPTPGRGKKKGHYKNP